MATLTLSKPSTRVVPKDPRKQAAQCLEELREAYPDSIGADKPLVIGASDQIVALQADHYSEETLRRATAMYCHSDPYLEACIEKGAMRFNLDGSEACEVKHTHRIFTQGRLFERRRKAQRPHDRLKSLS